MTSRKTVSLYRKNLIPSQNIDNVQEFWLYSYSAFDERGNQTEQSVYAQDKSIVERTLKEYNDKGFLIREKYYVEDGHPSEEKSYERDENGLVTKEIKHYIDGSYDTTIYEYDTQHRIVSKITTNDDGEIEQKVLNEYRDDFLVKTLVTDGDDKLVKQDEFKYDEKGNSVEHKRIDNESGDEYFVVTAYNSNGRKKHESRYDEDGEVMHQTTYLEDEQGHLVRITEENSERAVEIKFTYDEKGNAVQQEEFDTEGKQLVSVQRGFDEDNNLVRSEVFIDGQGLTLPQHYEIRFEYEFYEEKS